MPFFGGVSGVAVNYLRAIQRVWTGNEGEQGSLAPEIQPSYEFFSDPFAMAVAGVQLWGGFISQAAGAAATFAKVGVSLPVTSTLLVTIEGAMLIGMPVNAECEVRVGSIAGFAGTAPTNSRDSRLPVLGGGALQPIMRSEATATTEGNVIGRVQMFAAAVNLFAAPILFPVVIHPGSGLHFRTLDDAAGLAVSMWGRARAAQPSELRP